MPSDINYLAVLTAHKDPKKAFKTRLWLSKMVIRREHKVRALILNWFLFSKDCAGGFEAL